jgi:hypothetical protein
MTLLDQLRDDLPDIGSLMEFVHKEVLYDRLVRKSVEAGYMTEQELVVGRYISTYLDLNYYIPGREEVPDKKDPLYLRVMINAQTRAAAAFGIPDVKAGELYLKSQDIRAVQIEDFPPEHFQYQGNRDRSGN